MEAGYEESRAADAKKLPMGMGNWLYSSYPIAYMALGVGLQTYYQVRSTLGVRQEGAECRWDWWSPICWWQ